MNRALCSNIVRVVPRFLAAAGLVALLGLAGPRPAAASEAPRVAIESFRGPQAQRIQGAVETGLVGRYFVVPDFSVEEVARRKGLGLVLDDEFAEVGKALDVRAFVSAEIQRRSGWRVRLLVRRGDTGAALGRILVADRKLEGLERQLTRRTSARIRALLARAASGDVEPPPLAPSLGARDEGEELETELVESAAPAGAGQGRGALLEVWADARRFSRSFAYTQNLTGLPEYRLDGAMAGAVEAAFHPGVLLHPALAPVGITAALEYGLGVHSSTGEEDGESRASDVHGYTVGLRYRFGLGRHELAPHLGYSARAFTTGDTQARTPDVNYRLLSAGLGGRAEVAERIALRARASYLHGLEAGPLTQAGRFPRATVAGMEVEAALGYAISSVLEVRVLGGVRRLGWDMKSEPGDAWVAGGAVDQSVWAGAGLALGTGR